MTNSMTTGNLLWTILFAVSIAQALFLLSLLIHRRGRNRLASILIAVMVGIMVLPNVNHLSLTSGLYRIFPGLFGISFGAFFLFGPLCYFYTRALLDDSFVWRWPLFLHFIPYLVNRLFLLQLDRLDAESRILGADWFLSGALRVRPEGYLFFAASIVFFAGYLFLSRRLVREVMSDRGNVTYIVPLAGRGQWLKRLQLSFTALLLFATAYFIDLLVTGTYSATASYLYTLTLSAMIYVIAYQLVLNPGLVSPDFSPKYGTYRTFNNGDGDVFIRKLTQEMEEKKAYLDADLDLASLSGSIGLPPHRLSRLINERFGKTFADYVNGYRVQEFIRKVNAPEFRSHSIYGLALDTGFNSKSSFNTAFKKITGKTPSEIRTQS